MCPLIRETRRRWGDRGDAGKALGNEQESKATCETLAEWVMCKGTVSLSRDLCCSDGLVHVWEVAERKCGRAGKKGQWTGNTGRHEPDPSEHCCFGNCCDCKHMLIHLPRSDCSFRMDMGRQVGHEKGEPLLQEQGEDQENYFTTTLCLERSVPSQSSLLAQLLPMMSSFHSIEWRIWNFKNATISISFRSSNQDSQFNIQ